MKNKIISVIATLLLLAGLSSLNAQTYHFQEGFASVEVEGWTIDGYTSLSSNNNHGSYEGNSGLKVRATTIQMPNLLNSLQFSFWYKATAYKDELEGGFTVEKSTDNGNSWTRLDTVTIDSGIEFTECTYDINETESCIMRITFSRVSGLIFIDDIALTTVAPTFATDDVSIAEITSSCMTVSSEKIEFTENSSGVYVAHDSIGFDAACTLSCKAFSDKATVSVIEQANPLPGERDTAIFTVTSEDASKIASYKAIVFRSLYQAKMGFTSAISQSTSEYDGWTFGGTRYVADSKGNGGAYPGAFAMRLSDSKGQVTSPKFSSVSTLSFVAKFSKTDGETLSVQTSTDGTTFTDVKTYTPGIEIPSYIGESSSDTLSDVQILNIDATDVYIRFQYNNGTKSGQRLMVDDIAIKADYDYTATPDITFNVYDFDKQALAGVTVTLGTNNAITDASGMVTFSDVVPAVTSTYSLSLADYITKDGSMSLLNSQDVNVMLLKEELEIFLALGQSNMAGRGDVGTHTGSLEGAYLLDDNGSWIPAQNPMNAYSNIRKDLEDQKMGPSYSFAQTMAKYLDKRVCMIVNAKGGTSITKFIEGGEYHEPLMTRVEEANEYGDVKAIIWHQGESNSSSFGTYLTRLEGLVEDIRIATGDDSYFVAGELGSWGTKYKDFNDNLVNITSTITNSSYVQSDSLTHIGDSTHFNTEAQMVMGQRYAQSVLHEVYNIDVAVFNLVIEGNVTVSCGTDVMDASGSFTPLWANDSVLRIETPFGYKLTTLTINGVTIDAAAGATGFDYTPASSDQKLNIVAMLEEVATSNESVESSTLSLYPNPTSGTLTFDGGEDVYQVSLYDLSGRQLMNCTCKSSIDVSSFTEGCYMIKLTSGKASITEKIIIK